MPYYEEDGESFCPDRSIGYLCRRVFQVSHILLEDVFAAEDVTSTQWSVLATLYVTKGSTAAALAREIGYDKGAMTRLIDGLVRRQLVARDPDPNDRRVTNLHLTEAGTTLALKLKKKVIHRWNEWLEEIGTPEIDRLVDGLANLKLRLDRLAADTPA